MVEELKVLAEVLKGVTNGAIIGVVAYLVIDLLKIIAIGGFSYLSIKSIVQNVFKPSEKDAVSKD